MRRNGNAGGAAGRVRPWVAGWVLGLTMGWGMADQGDLSVYRDLRAAGLSGESVEAAGVVLRRESFELEFTHGRFHLLTPVAGRVTGAVFLGQARIRVTPARPAERRFLERLTGGQPFEDTFDRLLLRFTDGSADEIRAAGRTETGVADNRAANWLEDRRKHLRREMKTNVDLRVFQDLAQEGAGGWFAALGSGARYGEMALLVDPRGIEAVAPEQVALMLWHHDRRGIWLAEPLHVDAGRVEFPADHLRPIDLLHVDLDIRCERERLDGRATLRFTVREDGLRVLPLKLFPRLRVSAVTGAGGAAMDHIQEDEKEDADFAVVFPEALSAGREYEITVAYAGDKAIENMGGGNHTLVARDSWYPNNGFGDRATFDMTLSVPKGLTLVATGQPVGPAVNQGNRTVSRWRSEVPIAVAGFNYGRFRTETVQDERSGLTVEVYANTRLPDTFQGLIHQLEQLERRAGMQLDHTLGSLNTAGMLRRTMAETRAALEIYVDQFGPLPFDRLAVGQQPYPHFGQAWPMLVYMPLTAFFSSTHRAQLGMTGAADFFQYVNAHEVAHQWWGHLVGWKSYRDQWLSEGLAEFSTSLYAQRVYGNDDFTAFWAKSRKRLLDRNVKGVAPIEAGGPTMGYRLNNGRDGEVGVPVIYSKGALIFHMLRMLMWHPQQGDAAFMAMIRDLIERYRGRDLCTAGFQAVVEGHLTPELDLAGNGRLDWFFDQWVHGTALPRYRIDHRLEPAGDGRTRLLVRVTQSEVDDGFVMRVPIYVEFDKQVVRVGSVVLRGNETTPEIAVSLPRPPTRVRLCAYEDVLARID